VQKDFFFFFFPLLLYALSIVSRGRLCVLMSYIRRNASLYVLVLLKRQHQVCAHKMEDAILVESDQGRYISLDTGNIAEDRRKSVNMNMRRKNKFQIPYWLIFWVAFWLVSLWAMLDRFFWNLFPMTINFPPIMVILLFFKSVFFLSLLILSFGYICIILKSNHLESLSLIIRSFLCVSFVRKFNLFLSKFIRLVICIILNCSKKQSLQSLSLLIH
jgi:hypothetical protein